MAVYVLWQHGHLYVVGACPDICKSNCGSMAVYMLWQHGLLSLSLSLYVYIYIYVAAAWPYMSCGSMAIYTSLAHVPIYVNPIVADAQSM